MKTKSKNICPESKKKTNIKKLTNDLIVGLNFLPSCIVLFHWYSWKRTSISFRWF